MAKLKSIKCKHFFSKGTVQRVKRQTPQWAETLAKHISDKELGSRIQKELASLSSKKINNSVKNKQGKY